MSTKLTIDEGNSWMKIRLWRDDEALADVVGRIGDLSELAGLDVCSEKLDELIFCSVCSRDRAEVERLLAPLARKVVVLDSSTPVPLTVGYRTPSTLGVDRVAAAAGAAAIAPGETCLVVDLGTAITYDVVTADGRFLGGNIAPGIYMRLEALHSFTRALPAVDTAGDCPLWGYDTETALRSGAVRGVVGELQYYFDSLAAAGREPRVILTGGSADLITPFITMPVTIEPNLVLIGLNSILKHNEN